MEARAGIEPAYTDLQSAASPLRHRAERPSQRKVALGGSGPLAPRLQLGNGIREPRQSYGSNLFTQRQSGPCAQGRAGGLIMTIESLLSPITGKPGPARLENAQDWMQGRTLYGGGE